MVVGMVDLCTLQSLLEWLVLHALDGFLYALDDASTMPAAKGTDSSIKYRIIPILPLDVLLVRYAAIASAFT